MSSVNSFLPIKIVLGLLFSCCVVSGQPLLLTGPVMTKKSISPNVIRLKTLAIKKPLLHLQSIYPRQGPRYGLTRIMVNPMKVSANGHRSDIFCKRLGWQTIEAFCFEIATQRMKSFMISAENK